MNDNSTDNTSNGKNPAGERPVNVVQFTWAQLIGIATVVIALAAFAQINTNNRFDAVNQRIDDLIAANNASFEAVNNRLDDFNDRFADINARFIEMNNRLISLESTVSDLLVRVTRIETHLRIGIPNTEDTSSPEHPDVAVQ